MNVPLELRRASDFLSRYLQGAAPDRLAAFRDSLERDLLDRYRGHWFPDEPDRGNAYRALCSFGEVDPILRSALLASNLTASQHLFPTDFVLWCDPGSVSYRVGTGSVFTVYAGPNAGGRSQAQGGKKKDTAPKPQHQQRGPAKLQQQQQIRQVGVPDSVTAGPGLNRSARRRSRHHGQNQMFITPTAVVGSLPSPAPSPTHAEPRVQSRFAFARAPSTGGADVAPSSPVSATGSGSTSPLSLSTSFSDQELGNMSGPSVGTGTGSSPEPEVEAGKEGWGKVGADWSRWRWGGDAVEGAGAQ